MHIRSIHSLCGYRYIPTWPHDSSRSLNTSSSFGTVVHCWCKFSLSSQKYYPNVQWWKLLNSRWTCKSSLKHHHNSRTLGIKITKLPIGQGLLIEYTLDNKDKEKAGKFCLFRCTAYMLDWQSKLPDLLIDGCQMAPNYIHWNSVFCTFIHVFDQLTDRLTDWFTAW